MSTTNTALIGHLGREGYSLDDAKTAGTASSQSGANAITSQCSRITSAVANGSMILRSILSNDCPDMCFVINDSAQAIKVFAFAGENVNGSLNASLTIAAGAFGLFSRIKSTLDWRAAAIS